VRNNDEVSQKPAAGASTLSQVYGLRNPQPLTGLTYYRLRQVDADKKVTYSPVVTLAPTAREAAQANVYPNPATGNAVGRASLRGLADQRVTVGVTDMLERLITMQHWLPATYLADIPLTLSPTTLAGIYAVSSTAGSQTWTTRWTVEP